MHLGVTLTLALHVQGTPVGHWLVLDVWQDPGTDQAISQGRDQAQGCDVGFNVSAVLQCALLALRAPSWPGQAQLTRSAGGDGLLFPAATQELAQRTGACWWMCWQEGAPLLEWGALWHMGCRLLVPAVLSEAGQWDPASCLHFHSHLSCSCTAGVARS